MAGKLLRRRYDDKKTSARDDERSFFLRDAMGWPTVTAIGYERSLLVIVRRTEQSDPWKFQSHRPLDELARLGLFPHIALVFRIALYVAWLVVPA